MKKKIAILAVFTFCGYILHSQNTIQLAAGYNQSFLYEIGSSGSYRYGPPEFGSKPAFYFGFTYYKDKGKAVHCETWLDFTQKNFSLDYTSGGIGFWESYDCDYQSSYIDFSYFPVIEIGKKFRVAGSVRPGLGILLYSYREGEFTSYYIGDTYIDTEQISESCRYFLVSLDIIYNIRFMYVIGERSAIILEGQYSQGITDNQLGAGIKLNFNNYSIGSGIVLFL